LTSIDQGIQCWDTNRSEKYLLTSIKRPSHLPSEIQSEDIHE